MEDINIKNLFENYRNIILEAMPFAQVEHVGGSSIPGINTKGDLDIQIRVDNKDFLKAVAKCDEIFLSRYKEIWADEFALFGDPKQVIKIDIMLTVVDSAYDSFYQIRDAMINDHTLLERYNELKKQYSNFLSDDYRKAKHLFFRQLEKELGLKVRPESNFVEVSNYKLK